MRKRESQNNDLAKVELALRRAAAKAKRIAMETNTPLVVYKRGRVIKEFPSG